MFEKVFLGTVEIVRGEFLRVTQRRKGGRSLAHYN